MSEPFDAVIVGSGAGGGIAAYVLARAGLNVCVLEKGPHLTPANYGDDELRFGERALIDQDPKVEPRTFRNRPEEGEHIYVGKILGCSRCVGGGSVHYAAASFRFTPEDFRARSTFGDLPGADIRNWPLTYEDLRPYYGEVERLVGVAGGDLTSGAPAAGEWRQDKYPMPGHPANYGALLFERATQKMGLQPYPTPVSIANGDYVYEDRDLGPQEERCGCSYCGFCSSHGCPIESKGDTRVTALRLATAGGRRCEIRADSFAYRVEVEGGRAKRVLYLDGLGNPQSVEGKAIILACSTIDTPRLALMSDLPYNLVNHDLIGRYLMVHHFAGGIGFFNERIDYYRGFWSMRCLDDFYFGFDRNNPVYGFGNIQTMGPSSGYGLGAGGIISMAKLAGWGRGHKQFMTEAFGHSQWLGLVGMDAPVKSNRVDLDPTVKDAYGFPVPRITYSHHPNDVAVSTQMVPVMSSILGAMGAASTQMVMPIGAPTEIPQMGGAGSGKHGPGRQAPDPIGGLVNHQMGTMRMGRDPDTSVVNEWQAFHGIPNLYVTDASVMVTSGGYNPTLTLEALAWRAAQHIVDTPGA